MQVYHDVLSAFICNPEFISFASVNIIQMYFLQKITANINRFSNMFKINN